MTPSLNSDQGLLVYTDGSASNRDRSGGWAFVVLDAYEGYYEQAGAASDTSVGAMELTAALMAITWTYITCGISDLLVQSDSEYVVKGFMDPSRARNKNMLLWQQLDTAADQHKYVQFEHVRGHTGNTHNERCDKLAGAARKKGLNR